MLSTHEDSGGFRVAAARLRKIHDGAVDIIGYLPGEKHRLKVSLEDTRPTQTSAGEFNLVDTRKGDYYSLKLCNDKEMASARAVFERHDDEDDTEQVVELTPKEIAMRLMGVVSEKPRGSKALARLAEIEYSEVVLQVLQLLHRAGKIGMVRTDEGKAKWTMI